MSNAPEQQNINNDALLKMFSGQAKLDHGRDFYNEMQKNAPHNGSQEDMINQLKKTVSSTLDQGPKRVEADERKPPPPDTKPVAQAPAGEINLSFSQWFEIYEGMLQQALAKAAPMIETKLKQKESWTSIQLKYNLINNKLNRPETVAEVGVEIFLTHNGVRRLMMRKVKNFKHIKHYKEGRDQGMVEAIQEVFADFATFAVATDIAMKDAERQQNDMQ